MEFNTEILASYVEEANNTCIPAILQLIRNSGPLMFMFSTSYRGNEKEKILETLMDTFYFVFFKKFKGEIRIGSVIQEIIKVFRYETQMHWKSDWQWREKEIDEEIVKKCEENGVNEAKIVIYKAICYAIDNSFIGKVDHKPRGFFMMIFHRISSAMEISPSDAAIAITKVIIEVLNEVAIQEFEAVFEELKRLQDIRYEQHFAGI